MTTDTARLRRAPGAVPDFLFGAATAAFQIEGAAHEDGRRDSIWDAFCRVPGAVIDGDNGDVACDHYHRYRDDVALMADLGLQTYRFSTSWSRVRPDGGALNPKGLDFYSRLVDELLDADILPWLTLYHWDLPQALQEDGGWANRDTADRFAEYALDMHDALGDRVNVWTTLNEPWCSSFLSYTGGVHAPGRQEPAAGLAAAHHLLLAHGLGVRALRARDSSLQPRHHAEPHRGRPGGPGRSRRPGCRTPHRRAVQPVLPRSDLPRPIPRRRASTTWVPALDAVRARRATSTIIATPIDTLGVNYYHGELVSARPAHAGDALAPPTAAPSARPKRSPFPAAEGVHWHERGLPRTAMDWEVQPEGLTRLLRRVHEEYTGPAGVRLLVTENGAAYDDDGGRTAWSTTASAPTSCATTSERSSTRSTRACRSRGYFDWSLLDNFEWAWGYDKRFGIVRVDYDTQERIPKSSALELRRIITERTLQPLASPVLDFRS